MRASSSRSTRRVGCLCESRHRFPLLFAVETDDISYYLQRGENVKPFPPDFRIIAGDARRRNASYDLDIEKSAWAGLGLSTDQDFLRQKAVGFNCLNYAAPAEAALGLSKIPQDRRCPDGLRAEVFFPSCWDGVNSDSDDHKSHMAYPSTMDNGDCPEGYPVRLPSLFFETIWNVDVVAGRGGKLVFSTGDEEGTFPFRSMRSHPPPPPSENKASHLYLTHANTSSPPTLF
jgi:hypothetical protein